MRSLRLLSLLLSLPVTLSAQGAVGAARAFLEARARQDWAAVADFADSAGLAAIRGVATRTLEEVAMLQRADVRETLTAAGVDAPLKMLDATRSVVGGGSLLQLTFAGVTDTATLRTASDRELVARWFQAKDLSYVGSLIINGMMSALIDRAPDADGLRAELNSVEIAPIRWEIVGAIDEPAGGGVVHVIYRTTATAPPGVLSFKEHRGRWYLASLEGSEQVDQLVRLELAARQRDRAR